MITQEKREKNKKAYERRKAKDPEGFLEDARKRKQRNIEKLRKDNPKEYSRRTRQYYLTAKKKDSEKILRQCRATGAKYKSTETYSKWYKQWRKKNRNRLLVYSLKYNKEYRKTEKGKANGLAAMRNRRGRLVSCGGCVAPSEWLEILEMYNHRCAYCGIGGKLTMDHVMPLSRGGIHKPENVVPACRSCNAKKFVSLNWKPKVFPKR